jgi:(S)-2-hydroxyglutarate dehydrogenase
MYDFIIIGAGIVGMSTAMQLKRAYPDRRMLLVEKEKGPARHQTGHNSGVIHAGVYYKPGSSKARFCRKGNQAMREFCDEHRIPYEICGKLLVATNELEMQRMHALWERIGANGISREWLSGDALREMEPNISGLGGIFVADSGIVDFTEVARVMGGEFARMGGEIRYDCAVTALEERRNEVVVHTTQGSFTTRYLVSCSGLMADRLIRMLGQNPGFTICPFRGEYFVLPTKHNQIVQPSDLPDSGSRQCHFLAYT